MLTRLETVVAEQLARLIVENSELEKELFKLKDRVEALEKKEYSCIAQTKVTPIKSKVKEDFSSITGDILEEYIKEHDLDNP